MLSTAESCTGGFLSKVITDIPGSSAWFERGFIVYSEQAKCELLGVQPATLTQFGAVSQETVQEMAQGALKHSHAQVSVAITGIAGPSGATPSKPLGLVWLAWASQAWPLKTSVYQFVGDREAVRTQSVKAALTGLEALLRQQI
ncbi:MAG: CinA family protein [Gammaproteobacteria bacterium]|nr:CinA family protein [Gammaproteobacteria bacterium]